MPENPKEKLKELNPRGWKTSEFWMTIAGLGITMLIPVISEWAQSAKQGTWAAILAPVILVAAFTISRGLAKKEVPPLHQQSLIEQSAQALALQTLNSPLGAKLESQYFGNGVGSGVGAGSAIGAAVGVASAVNTANAAVAEVADRAVELGKELGVGDGDGDSDEIAEPVDADWPEKGVPSE